MKHLISVILVIIALHVNAQQFTWTALPTHTYPDSLHWPFVLGVASSEPDTGSIYLWTYLEPDSNNQPIATMYWELSGDSNFTSTLQSGTIMTDSNSSWTSTFLVDSLDPDTYYWYRFHDGRGNYSVTGRTRTLPVESDHIRLVVASCSRLCSGFYNAYARIAERQNLHAVIHLGDWAYDNINMDRAIRYEVPDPGNVACEVNKRRKRDYVHLLDPDLRLVRQMHPFIYLWDNHDIQGDLSDSLTNNCRKVFREWTGMPLFDTNDPAKTYRKISMGPLADLFMIDVQYTRDNRDSIAPGAESYLGIDQFNWLIDGLRNSTAQWKLIGNQKLFTPFSTQGLEGFIPGGVGGDDKSWDSYPLERERLLTFMDTNDINNVMILSGDAHFTVVSDDPVNPFDSAQYNGETGEGSVAVEILPSAISSPNIDERGIPASSNDLLVSIAQSLNPQQFFVELMQNGYGLLDISPDSIHAQVWLMDVKQVTSQEHLAANLVLEDGVNHWKRGTLSTQIDVYKASGISAVSVYPNPANDRFTLEWTSKYKTDTEVRLVNTEGKTLLHQSLQSWQGINRTTIDLNKFPAGVYLVKLVTAGSVVTTQIIKQ